MRIDVEYRKALKENSMKYFLQSNPLIRIHDVDTVRIEPNPIAPNPGRNSHGLVFFTEGQTGFFFDGNYVEATQGSLLYLPKGVAYSFKREHSATCIRFNFDVLYNCDYPFFCRTYTNVSYLKELFLNMVRAGKASEAERDSILMVNAYKIISFVQANENVAYFSSQQFNKISESVRYIEDHFCDPDLSTPKLAKQCSISERYYTMLFNMFFMCSPKQYILNLKIDLAKKLLCSTDRYINEIASACGFSDVYYFCKTFKKHTNMTPSEYRKENISL